METLMIAINKEGAKILLDALFKYPMNSKKWKLVKEFREQLEKEFALKFVDWYVR